MAQKIGNPAYETTQTELRFGPFRLEGSKRLWRGDHAVEIRPRPLAMLRYLAERPGQLIAKNELLKQLWPGIYVSDTVVKVCTREIRQALQDDVATPQFIETAGTRGYRFIAPLITATPVASPQTEPPPSPPQSLIPNFTGREEELAQLQDWYDQMQQGAQQIVFVSGEAGIGKTTLVERFLAQVSGQDAIRIGRGHCLEQQERGEAYLPVLQALQQLCRTADGEAVIAVLRRYAPLWLLQLSGVIEADERETLQRQLQGSNPQRMLREFGEAIAHLTSEQVLFLVFEDLHWSDVATLELLSYLGQRREQTRLMVLSTYRPAETVASQHPLRRIEQEMIGRGQCHELALELWTEAEVERYLTSRLSASPVVAALWPVIHRCTDGNALFVAHFLDYLLHQKLLVATQDGWELRLEPTAIEELIPDHVQRLITKQIEGLSKDAQQALEVASMVGRTFTAYEAAAVLGSDPETLEVLYEELENQERLINIQEIAEWPNGTMAVRYRFRHALHRHVVYQRIGPARRMRWHRQLGEHLSNVYGEHAPEVASAIAFHFERGRDYPHAIRYYQQAGESALRRSAHVEAAQHLTQGLALLSTLPETSERMRQELALRIPLHVALLASHGLSAPELEENLERAQSLCNILDDLPQFTTVLIGLARLYITRSDRLKAEAAIEQEQHLLLRLTDPAILVKLHTQLGVLELVRGAHRRVQEHHAQVFALYDATAQSTLRFSFGIDPHALALVMSGVSLWLRGWPEQAWSAAERGIARAQEIAHPFSLANVLSFAVWVRQFRSELDQAWSLTQTLVTLEREYGFATNVSRTAIEQGCVLVRRGELTEGIQLLVEGINQHRATGAQIMLPYSLSFLAEAYGQQGQFAEGLATINEAIHLTETSFDRLWAAEVHRIKGELTLQQACFQESQKAKGKSQKLPTANLQAEAETCFHKAVEIARQQEAKSLELRAAMSLARLWRTQGKTTDAKQVLADIYGWFTEGFDTADLQQARTLLTELS